MQTFAFTIMSLDVNECMNSSNLCHSNANCINSDGSYVCTCMNGYTGDGFYCAGISQCDNVLQTLF